MMPDAIADAKPRNWVDRYAPAAWRPYFQLSRLDRPIGTWLLLLPCWWSIALAEPAGHWPDFYLAALFGVGAVVMRGAGCTLNDIVDRDFDGQVARTRNRPLPAGLVSVRQAVAWLAAQLGVGLIILVQLRPAAILLGVSSLGLVVIYPFMKRITWWPQFFLGLAFNWGALMGEAAVTDHVSLTSVLLYAAGILWTLGYDTIYAHQDKDDDALIGVKSTARLFGAQSRDWLNGFFAGMLVLLAVVGALAGLGLLYAVGLGAAGVLLWRQARRLDLDDGNACLAAFRQHRDIGLIILAGIMLARYFG